MKKTLFIVFLSIITSNLTVLAKNDSELMESKKCSNMFSYFEQKHNIPQNTLHAISLRETQKAHSKHRIGIVWPWTITVNPSGKGYHFKTRDEALKFAKETLAKGKGSIDVGCMQINLKYHPDAFDSIEDAFSPQKNVAYGATFLKEKHRQHGNWEKAIGSYHSSTPKKAASYHAKVKKTSNNMDAYKKSLAKIENASYKKTTASKQKFKKPETKKLQI